MRDLYPDVAEHIDVEVRLSNFFECLSKTMEFSILLGTGKTPRPQYNLNYDDMAEKFTEFFQNNINFRG